MVEISGQKKSDGWFFHAITGEEWLLKMKFRTTRSTFRQEDLVKKLDLKPLNDMPDLPLYGTEPRVKCRNLRGPWQEIELRVHSYDEIDRPEFWGFVDRAVQGFARFAKRVEEHADILQPWKQLGRKWHFSRKGFPLGKDILWNEKVLEKLIDLLTATAPDAEILWNNKQVVPFFVPQQKEPWAAVQTKKLDAVYLHLIGPKGRFTLGQITDLGLEPWVEGNRPNYDMLHLKFSTIADLSRGDLPGFLKKHLKAVTGTDRRLVDREIAIYPHVQLTNSKPIPVPLFLALPVSRAAMDRRGRGLGRAISPGEFQRIGRPGPDRRGPRRLEPIGPGIFRSGDRQAPSTLVPGEQARGFRLLPGLDRHPRRSQRAPRRPLLPSLDFFARRRRL